ncbi:helix-turn-helix domain-containing protein [Streptomyces lasiicapitis]|uniref:helix-turn-helix domain-containing protein n=1 Tax=Streptomyces lasiicapitis TaxID=1923961 RepID=UPI00365E315C
MATGKRLQQLRRAAGLSAHEVGVRLRQHHTTVTRAEQAKVALKWTTVKAMLEIYGVEEAEAQRFLALTEQANAPGWWQSYRDVLPHCAAQLVSLENSATHIRAYEPAVVPGLLQTQRYSRGVLRLERPRLATDELERRVALCAERQELLNRPNPPHLWVVMDETVLRRPVGEAGTLQAQIEYLIEATYLSNVTLQVLAFESGLPPGAFGPFTLFRFPMPDFPDIVWVENLAGPKCGEDRSEVTLHREVLDRMSAQALSKAGTREFLEDALKCWGR